MKKFLIQLFTSAGELISSRPLSADTYDEALKAAHNQVGSAQYLKENDLDLWVVPA